jgi:glycosyltransferase involved in cell wall biosynthesis
MSAFNGANFRKTIYYLRRNGLRSTWYAVRERFSRSSSGTYVYESPSEEALQKQRHKADEWEQSEDCERITFSIVVPTYRTKPEFLRELIESLLSQTYPFWQLILADATEDDSVLEVAREYLDAEQNCGDMNAACRICYKKLSRNAGISENTNQALEYAQGSYVGLLDHDDILTPDALYEMAETIRAARVRGVELQLLYSDEDKCDETATEFFEPNQKERFNYDLILSNNYICHFLVMEKALIQSLRFRQEFDGAQDYDLVLRAVETLEIPAHPEREELICHVPKVLYHWRCHSASTAENPRSKDYAYEAGKRAVQAHIDKCGFDGRVVTLKHLGFYQVQYPSGVLCARKDLGAVGGRILHRGKIAGGRMDESGKVFYEGLPAHYSGELHRAVLTQDALAVDIRCIAVREELHGLFQQVTGVAYQCRTGENVFDVSLLPADTDYKSLSLKLCKAIREQGYRILWLPVEEGI